MTCPTAVKYLCPLEVSIRMLLFSPLTVSENQKERKKKKTQNGVATRFYGVEKEPAALQRALGCLMMASPAPQGSFCLCRQSWPWQMPALRSGHLQ